MLLAMLLADGLLVACTSAGLNVDAALLEPLEQVELRLAIAPFV